jgi:hypothetical protein
MPWRQEARKDAVSCDKPRRAATRVDPWVSEWGNPAGVTAGDGGPKGPFKGPASRQAKPGEVKHLSNRRNRKRTIDSVSSGERSRKSPNPQGFLRGLKGPRCKRDAGAVRLSGWNAAPERVRGP